ncbi:Crp/Fnr family transcriptional regulator [Marinospirillum alkaliphilum]|uniref:cAMP-binding domain of CRP or a regulatory subunit of cAMP-dependent protein kinases n=1 Tax=Marinospirillum alkaliphilum DSM 21637 TaxID=1122209 RepID=A0A1K1XDH4_9GAMM|nr:Crp/Fnr family transcriptional regulator [Marinospirillum alkaliphilum]SFX47745.1 cAMP-binding domain of CRP or a regulatory subunit of cAMP-dependent protein kinases [Marinospirillum alkaliphilum DSM 21637]
MIPIPRLPAANQLIADLPDTVYKSLMKHCELVDLVDLVDGEKLCTQHERYSHAWFPVTACISVTASVAKHPAMEIGMIGHEGMLGATLLLATEQAPHDAIVTGPGSALRIHRDALHQLLSNNPTLVRCLQRYCYQLMVQLGQNTVCSRIHQVEARLARWLLMANDRGQKGHFYLTHLQLAEILGVRRSAVTLASGTLKQAGLIKYTRGNISIVNQTGLEAKACECYIPGQVHQEH